MNKALDILLGVAIGDALGVPYEFSSRTKMENFPAKDMVGYKVHNQPPGTWSDDSSLTFCLAEALLEEYDLAKIASNFVKWKHEAYWTARANVFDIGMTTSRAISELDEILKEGAISKLKDLKLKARETDNGNGSLMRILPLIFEIKGCPLQKQFGIVWENSALTHKHIRAGMSCMIYLKFAEYLLSGMEKNKAYNRTRTDIKDLWVEISFSESEQQHFKRIITNDIRNVPQDGIKSGGYVIEPLEASFWCLLKTESFEQAVLRAINFGHDTDTTGAITGGIAGIYYSMRNMPEYWIASIARMEDIIELGEKLYEKYNW